MSTHSWNTEETPDFENMSTIPIPAESTVRDLAGDVRDIDVEDDRVSVDFDGLLPESHAAVFKHQLMFNIWPPFHRTFDTDCDVRFSARETVHVAGEGDVYVRAFVSADDGEVTEVEFTAYPA
jgi:hypothetical protein